MAELARCDTADLVKLFGSPSRRHDRTSPAPADVSTVDTLPADQPTSGPVPAESEHGLAWGNAGAKLSGAVLQVANPPEPKRDSNGYRISPPVILIRDVFATVRAPSAPLSWRVPT
jgi:hypothetical protein